MTEEDEQILQTLTTQELSKNEKEELLQSYKRRKGLIDVDLSVVDIDELLRPLVKELNDSGFKTFSSCSGHNKRDGYVGLYHDRFFTSEEKKELNSIFSRHGIDSFRVWKPSSFDDQEIGEDVWLKFVL